MQTRDLLAAFDLQVDERLNVVWLSWQHATFRVNCSDLEAMQFWAYYYFFREFPRSTSLERSEFRQRFRAFYELNRECIEQLAQKAKIRRVKTLEELIREIISELRRLQVREEIRTWRQKHNVE
jgi:hypothetical protein